MALSINYFIAEILSIVSNNGKVWKSAVEKSVGKDLENTLSDISVGSYHQVLELLPKRSKPNVKRKN